MGVRGLELTIPDQVTVSTADARERIRGRITAVRDRPLRTAPVAAVALAGFDIIGLTVRHEPLQLRAGVPYDIEVVIGGVVEPGTYRRRAVLRCAIDKGQIVSNWATFVVVADS